MRVELRAAPKTGPLRESTLQKQLIQRNTMARSQLSQIAFTCLDSLRNLSVRRTRGTLRAAGRRALLVSLPIQETWVSAILSLVMIQTWTRLNNQTYAHSEVKMKVSKNSQAKTQYIKIKTSSHFHWKAVIFNINIILIICCENQSIFSIGNQ